MKTNQGYVYYSGCKEEVVGRYRGLKVQHCSRLLITLVSDILRAWICFYTYLPYPRRHLCFVLSRMIILLKPTYPIKSPNTYHH